MSFYSSASETGSHRPGSNEKESQSILNNKNKNSPSLIHVKNMKDTCVGCVLALYTIHRSVTCDFEESLNLQNAKDHNGDHFTLWLKYLRINEIDPRDEYYYAYSFEGEESRFNDNDTTSLVIMICSDKTIFYRLLKESKDLETWTEGTH